MEETKGCIRRVGRLAKGHTANRWGDKRAQLPTCAESPLPANNNTTKKNKICCSKITWGSHCSFKTLSCFLAHGMCSVYIQNTINYYMVPNAPGKCGSCSIITNLRGGDKEGD